MPQSAQHKAQAEFNEKAISHSRGAFDDWAVTMCFYAAVHWIEWYAIDNGDDVTAMYPHETTRHAVRERYVKDLSYTFGDPGLRVNYKLLDSESRKARYLKNLIADAHTHYGGIGCKRSEDALKFLKMSLGIT